MTRWDDNGMLSIYNGVSRIYAPRYSFPHCYPCIPVHSPSPHNDIIGGLNQSSSEIHLLGVCNWASLEIHFEAVTKRVWRDVLGGHDHANLQAIWSHGGDRLGGRDWASLEMLMQAVIQQVWRYSWRPWSGEFEDMHIEALIMRTCRQL